MNRDSAQSFYLGSEDIEEAWEERLLAHIEFFRTKVAVPKLVQSRIAKLNNDWQAAEILLEEEFDTSLSQLDLPDFPDLILPSVQTYYTSLAEIHSKMHQNPNPSNVIFLANKKQELTGRFAQFVSESCQWEGVGDVSIGIEPDPMRIFESIRTFEEQGVTRYGQLEAHSLEPLVLEVKRWLRLGEQFKEEDV